MKNQLSNLKAVETGAHKAEVGASSGAGAGTSEKSDLELKKIVSAPQH
jgi:hypothetical protein